MEQSDQADIKTRVLVVKLSSLGDLFHALPAVHMLKTQLNATVDWVTQTEYAQLVECFTDIDRVIAFPRRRSDGGKIAFLREALSHRYDYIVDFQGLMKSALLARMARGTRRIGPSFHREGSKAFYSSVAGELDKNRHAIHENLDVVRHLGLEVTGIEFPMAFPDLVKDRPSPRIALFPVTRWKNKCWPEESFVTAGRMLRNKTGASIYLFGSKVDRPVCSRIEAGIGGVVTNLTGRTSLVELGSFLASMDLVIANDSGPMHFAAAIGVPVLAVFGPTDPGRTGPYGGRHKVLVGRRSCRPCMSRKCRFDAVVCMREVTAAAVVRAAMEMLGLASA